MDVHVARMAETNNAHKIEEKSEEEKKTWRK
jgi:hypothetical protein